MENEKTYSRTQLIVTMSIGAIIGICIGLTGAYILFKHNPIDLSGLAKGINGEVKLGEAIKSTEAYRHQDALALLGRHHKGKTSGVTYDTAEFMQDYRKFKNFIDQNENALRKDCIWRVGVYPNIVLDGPKKIARLNVYFVPTMFDTITKKAHDFLDEGYDEKESTKAPPYIFDQGTLFP
jgi:hypothetical protein